MSRLILSTFALLFIVIANGCASSCNSCSSWSPRDMWANRPKPLQRLFRGEACNTCNPPVGQLDYSGGNVVRRCPTGTCGAGAYQGMPVETVAPGQEVPYYPSDVQPQGSQNANPASPGSMVPGPDFSLNGRTRANYPATHSAARFGPETGSVAKIESPAIETNAEVVTPPMYGNRNLFD